MMKFDMGGSVVVIGVMCSIVEFKLVGVEVYMVVVFCENMVNGFVVYFGDIVMVVNGMMIEINNIDVEGCFIFVDVLFYVCE